MARRMLGKLILALSLASAVPVLVSALLFASSLTPARPPLTLTRGLTLVALGGVSSAVGAAMLWWLASRTDRVGAPPTPEPGAPANRAPASDEGGGPTDPLMDTFSRALGSIQQQADDLDQFGSRLDVAYREIQTSRARLQEFSFKDEVTGLYNRRFFSVRLEEEVSRYRRFNHPVSVVLLDLDGFKAVNDELGHAAGDETLRGMAETLLKHSRGINVICRYGGDEFAILLVETSKAGARQYADRIRDIVAAHRLGHGRRVTASFGIAALPEDAAPDPTELIRAADEALYAAKRAGKNRVSLHGEAGASRPSAGAPDPSS